MISAQGLGAFVPGRNCPRWLFRDLDVEMTPGQLWVLVGPNGSGKSTLLRCLAGLRTADDGRVMVDRQTLAEMHPRDRARRIAYLPQHTTFDHDLRIADLVMLGRTPHLGRLRAPSSLDHEQVVSVLERVDLAGFGERKVATLSGGELQRAMVARMLATEAKTLLLDEPTNALDIGHALSLLELCRELTTRGQCVVMALHDLDLAWQYAQHAICLTADSKHHIGPARKVLHPGILESVFDVAIELDAAGLRFRPR